MPSIKKEYQVKKFLDQANLSISKVRQLKNGEKEEVNK